jgi:hypothetical protein
MVADYYEISKKTIESLIDDHNDEVIADGLKVLKDSELKEFKALLLKEGNLPKSIKFAPSLTIIPRRAILRIGMLLEESEVAKKVRDYLLDVEENTDISSKLLALSTENMNKINVIDGRLIRLENVTNTLESTTEEQRHLTNIVIEKLNEILGQPLFKINENMSNAYDNLVLIEFANAMNLYGNPASRFGAFNKAFENWVGLFDNRIVNKKQYNIYHYGIEIIRQFVFGVKQGIIKKNKNDNWISLSGIYSNKVEWQKLLDEFDHKCAYCGAKEFEIVLMADHLIPQSGKSSSDIYYNLVPCCSNCNDSKKNRKTSEWFKEQEFYTSEKEDILQNHWDRFFIKA